MTDQNNTKKPARVKRMFRWVFLAVKWLFVVLLVLGLSAGLYFQAPWKVLTLIAIILASLTVIPKRARKWIWLTFGIIIIALIVWVFLPEEDGDWRPYTFDEELAAIEAKRAIPEEENAATIYNKLIKIFDVNDFKPDFMGDDLDCITRSGPWKSDECPQLALWITEKNKTIETLLEASEKDQCRFPIYADLINLEKTFEYNIPVKYWSRLLVRAANYDLGNGQIDRSLRKQLAVLQIASHMYQQMTMMDFLIALAVEGIAIGQINESVINCELVEQNLSSIDKAIEEIDFNWSADLPRILDYQKLFAKNFFGMYYQVNSEGKIRFLRNSSHIYLKRVQQPVTYWRKRLDRAWVIYYWFVLPTKPKTTGTILENEFSDYYEMSNFEYQWPTESPSFEDLMLKIPSYLTWLFWKQCGPQKAMYHILYERWLETLARRHAARIIVALRHYKNVHGRWPQSLADVKSLAPSELFVDPINNGSFVYRFTDDGFTIYSKGKNNIDENGESRKKKPDGSRTDDILIWPPKSRKAKREAATQSD
ncbi:MAG TPA: hypothetical protein HPP87_04985 [Planctomycetes bacterium]|nr:hypothetical protein [Planctomycetota bacterium]